MDMTVSDVRSLVDLHQSMDSEIGNGKIAVAASKDGVFGMARMREMMSDGRRSAEFRVFREVSEAAKWLGLPGLRDDLFR